MGRDRTTLAARRVGVAALVAKVRKEGGATVVSMKDDWKRVFPFEK